ncbi:conserved hypothetical protein [Hyella patelloides LEGE 07179]|uniref:HTH araC/xylS-type domain-containing protein n=1 Tax=Hyella patelloides LEGE 07179 TaxID=945734 RepID=A0A563VNI4_9CYAN|nr:AraC family transcriptional regulator [Hyella patelloides]VEP12981.1 conserved hypothetical protein [Hyella patelloides LEGE 07179]
MNLSYLSRDGKFPDSISLSDINLLVKTEKLFFQAQHPLPLLNKVFRFIGENYQNQISLREVAQEVTRSPAYLTSLVRRETGKTVLAWIKEYRMAKARQLLLKTNQSVEQISEAVGYFDRRHFSRQFVQFHQLTPQAWRKKNQSGKSLLDLRIRNRGTDITNQESERLQVCLQELASILYQKTAPDRLIALEDIECDSIIQTDNGCIQVTFRTSAQLSS